MIIHGQFYDGIVGKPDLDDALEHYGIKGMKWKIRRKAREKIQTLKKKLSKKSSEQVSKEYDKWEPKTKEERMAYVSSRASQSQAEINSRDDVGSGTYKNSKGYNISIKPEESNSYRVKKKKK